MQFLADWLHTAGVPREVVPEQGRLLAERLPAGHRWTYREQRATLNDKYKALVDAAKDSNVEQMLEAFNARKGAAIGKPTV